MNDNAPIDSPSAYEAMAEAVRTSVDQLLIPFHETTEQQGSSPGLSTKEFFPRFLIYADKFTGQCCQDFAKILRRTSVVPEVRGTPTVQLAKQVRETVFDVTDKALVSYLQALVRINIDLRSVTNTISEGSIIGEAMKAAAIGRVAGGFGTSGKILGAVGAIEAAGKEAEKQAVLVSKQERLETEARLLAFSKILEFLKAVEDIPDNLLDYGCAKCFGGQIDFAMQAQASARLHSSVKERLEQALVFTLRTQQREQDRALALQQAQSEKAIVENNRGCGGCLLILGISFLAGTLGVVLPSHETAKSDGNPINPFLLFP